MWLALVLACGSRPAPQSGEDDDAPNVDAAPHEAEHGEHAAGHGEHAGPGEHGQDGHDDATVRHRFDDPAKWSAVFDDPARDAWQKPAELVAALAIPPGAAVADIGAGTGYFEPHLARAVGPSGRVIAIDIEPALVEHLKQRAVKDQTPQVEARLGKPDDPGLAAGEVDLVLIVDTYHHVDDRKVYFERLKAALRPGGRLVVVDFDPAGSEEHGPPREHRLAADTVVGELKAAGWTLLDQPKLLPDQYVLIFRPT